MFKDSFIATLTDNVLYEVGFSSTHVNSQSFMESSPVDLHSNAVSSTILLVLDWLAK